MTLILNDDIALETDLIIGCYRPPETTCTFVHVVHERGHIMVMDFLTAESADAFAQELRVALVERNQPAPLDLDSPGIYKVTYNIENAETCEVLAHITHINAVNESDACNQIKQNVGETLTRRVRFLNVERVE